METLMQAWSKGFSRFHPDAHLKLRKDTNLSAEAFDTLLDGTAQVAPFVRELFPSEIARFKQKFGYPPTLIAVAGGSYATKGGTHAIAIYVNESNPLKQLTLSQLREIYREGGTITRWGQLGLTGAWANQPINLYGMLRHRATGNPPGIVNFMQQRVLLGDEFKQTLREQVDAPGVTALDAIVRAVASDPNAIGYSGFANKLPGTKTLALAETANAKHFWTGTPDEVLRREYPLSRTIYLCVNLQPGHTLDPLLREFIRYTLSREGQQDVARDQAHFLPLPAPMLAAERAKIK
jgi:phosphate transport system substrate-binding protein